MNNVTRFIVRGLIIACKFAIGLLIFLLMKAIMKKMTKGIEKMLEGYHD